LADQVVGDHMQSEHGADSGGAEVVCLLGRRVPVAAGGDQANINPAFMAETIW
jgi:hypothetical protein